MVVWIFRLVGHRDDDIDGPFLERYYHAYYLGHP
jgi:hypothetical protein